MLSWSESSLQTAYSMVENSPCIFHSSNICFSFLPLNAIFHRAMEAHSHVLAFRGECLDCIMHMHSLAFAYAASCVCNTIYIKAPQRELRPNNVALSRASVPTKLFLVYKFPRDLLRLLHISSAGIQLH